MHVESVCLRLSCIGCEDQDVAAIVREKKPKAEKTGGARIKLDDEKHQACLGATAACDLRATTTGECTGKKGKKAEKASKDKAVKSVRGTHLLK